MSAQGTLRGMRGMSTTMKPMAVMQPLEDLNALQRREDERLKGWVKQVGEERAQAAWELKQQKRGYAGTTLPELLTEIWLRARNVRYAAQFDLGWARPDFALFDVEMARVVVWRVQGDYWHAGTQGHDQAQRSQLLATTIRGLPVARVADLWEKDIYQSDLVFEQALRGVEMRT